MDRYFISPYSLPLIPAGNKCTLCPHLCELSEGETGKCLVRSGCEAGILFTGYGEITNIAVEPIEKRPLFHFMPGEKFLSAGGAGCSLSCSYCMNWKVSQSADARTKYITPLQLVAMAEERGVKGICLTYNEPTVYAEYVVELGKLARFKRIPLVLKTNAFVNPDPWAEICSVVSAMNIDHKGPRPRYAEAGVDLPDIENLIRTNIQSAVKAGVHVEVSLPVHHDDHPGVFDGIRKDLSSIRKVMPVHLLQVFPAYKNKADTTSAELVEEVREMLMRRGALKYVYTSFYRNTVCHYCRLIYATRKGFDVSFTPYEDTEGCPECFRLDNEMWMNKEGKLP